MSAGITVTYPNGDVCSPMNRDAGYALLILNQPIRDKDFFLNLWDNARIRVCGDGGGNRLYDALTEEERARYLPTAIRGDLDSLRESVEEFYVSHHVDVEKDGDQDSTDFDKCLKYIYGRTDLSISHIVVYNCLAGRVDHAFHSIHQLYVHGDRDRHLFLISEDGLTFLLKEGETTMCLPGNLCGPACGLLPVGEPSVITTTGLEWDVADWTTSFGGNLSTSNVLKEDMVTVQTTKRIVFTVELKLDGVLQRS